ncbi:MAG: protein translocase subunit SecD, partial [Pirellulales bacterium]
AMFSSDVKRTYLFGARLLMGLVLVAGIAIGSPAAFAAQAPDAPAAASDSKAPDAKTNDKPAEAKPADTKPAGVPAATKAEPAKKVEAKSDDKPAPKQEPPKTEPQDKKGDAKGPEALPGELAEREPSDVDIRAVSKLSAKQKFERLDKKPRDEKLNEREYKAGREEDDALTPNAEFVALDRDADGSLSEEEFTSGFTNYWLLGLIVLAALVLPVGAGHWISKQLRMPDLGMRLAIILTVATVGTVIVVMDRMKLGIDLQGGVILIYEVDQGKTKQLMGDRDNFGSQSDYMDRLVGALNLRLNPGGQKELVIRKYGTNQVEIIVPEATPAEIASTMRRVSKAGFLEFRITANTRNLAKHLDLDAATAIKRVKANKGDVRIDAQRRILDDNQPGGMAFARWIEVDTVKMSDLVEDAQRADGLILRQNDKTEQIEALVILGKPIAESDTTYRLREDVVRGSDLAWASQDYDDQARICVGFSMTTRGANAMGRLTGENLPHDENYHYRLGIVFDGVLISAPNIQSTISERGIITGRFTEKEVSETVSVLNAGSLPAVLNEQPVSQYEISPTLGSDTIRQSTIAMYASTACILLFMVLYYRFSGVVACIALLMNLLITVAAMMFVDAALTLPGMAGLALTIGMAVDASVLIFERMREEQERGAAMRMVIRNGFDKAMTTIIDSNLTTVIVAFVLYAIGTDQIKGFAVTLMIGLLANLFTAITVSRVIFDIAERKRWLRQLSMGKLLGETHIDFVGKQRLAIGASVVLILVGLVAVAMRGGTLLDIDFAGGTSVQVALTEPMEVADVRSAVDAELPDVTVSEVHAANVTDGTRFKIDTSLGNPTSIDLEFDRRDADNDGRLDLAEYVDDRQGRIAEFAKKRFEELDNKNKKKDGYLVGVAAADGEFTITKDDVENYWLDKVFGDQLQRNRLAYRELKPLGAAKEPNAKKTDAEKTEV